MDILLEMFNEEEINDILWENKNISNLSNDDIKKNINILKTYGCNDKIIRNIILSNPYYLSRLPEDINGLIIKLKALRINNFSSLFDSYPTLLNKDSYEIDEFITSKIMDGLNVNVITDILNSFPYMIDEV